MKFAEKNACLNKMALKQRRLFVRYILKNVFISLNKIIIFEIGFSNGWKETFMSGDQEPWVFRGGLTADLQV